MVDAEYAVFGLVGAVWHLRLGRPRWAVPLMRPTVQLFVASAFFNIACAAVVLALLLARH